VSIRDFLRTFTRDGVFPRDIVFGPKILVGWLDPKFEEIAKVDGGCYSKFYPAPALTPFESGIALIQDLKNRYDIVHLLCNVSQEGDILDQHGNQTSMIVLIESCCAADVKLLWLASGNEPKWYSKGLRESQGRPLNLVVTLDRRGTRFAQFLESLLSRMSEGKGMPTAWVAVSPQNSDDPRNKDGPEVIYAAGRGRARFHKALVKA